MADDQAEPLACPTCARKFSLDERFCPDCEMPLVYVGQGEQEPITAAHEKARKVKPQYTSGEPVKVAFAQNLAEAQLIQGILLEEGIPSFERRTRGFDVPDFLAAGPRDILVPAAAVDAAHEMLHSTPAGDVGAAPDAGTASGPNPIAFALALILAVACGAIVVWVVFTLIG